MVPEQNSISIINRGGGQVTGENTNALPVRFIANFSWVKVFIAGFLFAIILMFIFVTIIKRQVVVVEVAGKSVDYTEYRVQ